MSSQELEKLELPRILDLLPGKHVALCLVKCIRRLAKWYPKVDPSALVLIEMLDLHLTGAFSVNDYWNYYWTVQAFKEPKNLWGNSIKKYLDFYALINKVSVYGCHYGSVTFTTLIAEFTTSCEYQDTLKEVALQHIFYDMSTLEKVLCGLQ